MKRAIALLLTALLLFPLTAMGEGAKDTLNTDHFRVEAEYTFEGTVPDDVQNQPLSTVYALLGDLTLKTGTQTLADGTLFSIEALVRDTSALRFTYQFSDGTAYLNSSFHGKDTYAFSEQDAMTLLGELIQADVGAADAKAQTDALAPFVSMLYGSEQGTALLEQVVADLIHAITVYNDAFAPYAKREEVRISSPLHDDAVTRITTNYDYEMIKSAFESAGKALLEGPGIAQIIDAITILGGEMTFEQDVYTQLAYNTGTLLLLLDENDQIVYRQETAADGQTLTYAKKGDTHSVSLQVVEPRGNHVDQLLSLEWTGARIDASIMLLDDHASFHLSQYQQELGDMTLTYLSGYLDMSEHSDAQLVFDHTSALYRTADGGFKETAITKVVLPYEEFVIKKKAQTVLPLPLPDNSRAVRLAAMTEDERVAQFQKVNAAIAIGTIKLMTLLPAELFAQFINIGE